MSDADSRRWRSSRTRCSRTSPSMPGGALAIRRTAAGTGSPVDAHFAVARDAREPGLQGRRQLPEILQEQRAAPRGGEPAVRRRQLKVGRRVGDRCAEQEPFEPSRVAVAARDADKRRRRSSAAFVERARDRFDFDAPLGDEQDAAVEAGGAAQQLLHASDRARSTDELRRISTRMHEPGGPTGGQRQRIWHG